MRGAGELFCRIRFLDANYDAAFACGGRLCLGLNCEEFAARTGGEPVIAALKGERVNQLHRCAVRWDYRGRHRGLASFRDVCFSFGSSLLCVNSLFETRAVAIGFAPAISIVGEVTTRSLALPLLTPTLATFGTNL